MSDSLFLFLWFFHLIRASSLQIHLKILDIGSNQIERLENLSHLGELEEFWVGYVSNWKKKIEMFLHGFFSVITTKSSPFKK